MPKQSEVLQEARDVARDHPEMPTRDLTAWELLRLVHKRVTGAHDNPPNARGMVRLTPTQGCECLETPFLVLILFALYEKRWIVAFYLFIVAAGLLIAWDASH